MQEYVIVNIHFVTCTIGEALLEINNQLNQAGLPNVTENDLIDEYPTEHEEDWFNDYMFVFRKIFTGNYEDIVHRLETYVDDFEINPEDE